MVTFANGMVVKELFLGVDHQARRLAYSVRTEGFEHHSASFTVTDLGGPEPPGLARRCAAR